MNVQLIFTGDGSHTLFLPDLNEQYHSTFGAIRESRHIFIENGFRHQTTGINTCRILEIGFGTGLNIYLTCLETEKSTLVIHYTALEPFPLDIDIIEKLNYPELISPVDEGLFWAIHTAPWNQEAKITDSFTLLKMKNKAEEVVLPKKSFDLVYFDAFGPDVQPDLWTEEVFTKIALAMKNGAALVTFSAKGAVRRAMKCAGLTIEKLPGPPGKREITRATKI
jgi:tRNA U34 5-methylaminomethyl-2-thiouridine-forming methyltransferase MnmC